jgi:predicted glycogen debranching enzyme
MTTCVSSREWLEADGFGGFASGTSTGIRTRRYHALLLTADTPPAGRMVLVNGFDAWIETEASRFDLSSQHYAPDVLSGDGAQRIEQFTADPWPRWVFRLDADTRIEQEILVARQAQITQVSWKLIGKQKKARLYVRPFLSGRDYHNLQKENSAFRFDATLEGERVTWKPYLDVPGVVALSNGRYQHEPHWYRNFRYTEETSRGLDDAEDLAAPGIFCFDLAEESVLMFTTPESPGFLQKQDLSTIRFAHAMRAYEESRRAEFASRLHRAADSYVVKGRNGKTIIAGYPWFTDWGRDTFIALRGLCIASGRLADARDILLTWADSVSEGMLPNRFPDQGEQAEYNSVDASLWFIIAVHELIQACNGNGGVLAAKDKRRLQNAVEAILEGYSKGTRFGIRMDSDGLLAAGERGVQLTWMDAKVGEWVVTPRAGKPVEVQALWLNALKIADQFSPGWDKHFQRGLESFREKFWNPDRGCLFDVIDVNHRPGERDPAFRPNQIFAIGGLPFQLIDGDRARIIVSTVEEKLLTPLGLRSLAPGEPNYRPHYQGGVWERDGAYHQGTVWPWLIGPFVEAWVRVRGYSGKKAARANFISPLLSHLDEAGLGHVSEIADADTPHVPRGCPFQAWSLGELLRLDCHVLKEPGTAKPTGKRARELITR